MLNQAIPELDTNGLRQFGLVFAAIIAGLFGVGLPLIFSYTLPWWPWILAAVLAGWALIAPPTLRGFYRLWMRFGMIMNAVMSRLILGLVFYLTVLPTGIIMRVLRKDPMRRNLEPQSQSYRVKSEKTPPERMRKPF